MPTKLRTRSPQELMWNDKDQQVGALDGILKGGHCQDILRKSNARQVLYILVPSVDEGGQGFWGARGVLRVRNLLFVHPHSHFRFEEVRVGGGVMGNDA